MNQDLSQVIVVNDSREPDVAGDVSLFRTAGDAGRGLEAIDVMSGEYFAYTLDGKPLSLLVEDGAVRVAASSSDKDCRAIVRHLLEETARHVLQAQRVRTARRAEPFGIRLMRLLGVSTEKDPEFTTRDLSAMSTAALANLIGFQA